MKEVHSTSSNVVFVPKKVKAVKSSLETLFNRERFEDDGENWRRSFECEENKVIGDAYDGNMWQTFQRNGDLFFNKVRNHGLMLKVDWFQPLNFYVVSHLVQFI